MRLAMHLTHSTLAEKVIIAMTGGPAHCELEFDGACHSSSAMDKGVRAKTINIDTPKWRVVEVGEWADVRLARKVFLKNEGKPYGWWDIILNHFFNFQRDQRGDTCSMITAKMLGHPSPVGISPRQLEMWVLDMNDRWRRLKTGGFV